MTKTGQPPEDPKRSEGLASLVGLWDDGDELADEVERGVAERRTSPPRVVPDLDRPG